MQAASADTALQTWLQWLENMGAAVTMRESAWLYPTVETAHILGFVVVVGAASMFDLRLFGASRGLPVTETARHLLPWSRAGLLAVVPSGLLLFISHATTLSVNSAFRLKLLLLVAAGANALMFHLWP